MLERALTDVEATLAGTRRILLAAGAGALGIAAAIVWLSIWRGLRPIGDMIDAAEPTTRIDATGLAAYAPDSPSADQEGFLERFRYWDTRSNIAFWEAQREASALDSNRLTGFLRYVASTVTK